jgi:hypothetical protein
MAAIEARAPRLWPAALRELPPCPQITSMPLRTPVDYGWIVGNGDRRLRLLFFLFSTAVEHGCHKNNGKEETANEH